MNNAIILPLVTILISFSAGMLLAPLLIGLLKKADSVQVILHYVKQHQDKTNLPTMGGWIFIIASLITTLALCKFKYRFALSALLIFFSYGIIGFLDDFIKIGLKRNQGLRAYQKIISQLLIAFIASYFAYRNTYIGSEINIPVIHTTLNLKWWYIPFSMFVYIALTNAVNLTDGLDGLAGSVSLIYLFVFLILIITAFFNAEYLGATFYSYELKSLSVFVASLIGGLLAFLWFNSYKAKIIMGDTGALALGGACSSIALFIRQPLLILFTGSLFILSCVSVILQVLYFKRTRKRIFLMSPFHHHLELKGLHEAKIVACYCIITLIGGIVALILV